MIFNKLFALMIIVGLFFQTTGAAQTKTPDVKQDTLTTELKEDALKLLSSVALETRQLNVPENRVRAQTIIADLMWEQDEREARAIFQNALGELKNLFGNANLPEGTELGNSERTEHYAKRYQLADIRRDFILTLASHDTQAALSALAAIKIRLLDEYDPLVTTELELQISSLIAKTDPSKSYSLAKAQLAGNGIKFEFIQALGELQRIDSKLAANLGRDVLAKIKNAKILSSSDSEKTANAAKTSKQVEIYFWQILNFINSVTEMNRIASHDKEKKMLPVLTDAEMKELVEMVANIYLTSRNSGEYSISQVMPEITRYAPQLAQRIRQKVGPQAAREFDQFIETTRYYNALNEKSAEELAADADRVAPDTRDRRYVDAVTKALNENEPEKAQAIAARIKDRKNYSYIFEQIQTALPLAKARRGDIAEVRKILATLKTEREKVVVLTELASAIAAKGDHETAKKLLDESGMMPVLLKKQPDLDSAVRFASVYAAVAPEQAFMILENGAVQMNEYINAGIKLDEFYSLGSVKADELFFNLINRQTLMHIPNSAKLLKNLASADFERTVSLAEKFGRPEIRLYVRLKIVQALLDADAAEKEDKDRDQLVSDDET